MCPANPMSGKNDRQGKGDGQNWLAEPGVQHASFELADCLNPEQGGQTALNSELEKWRRQVPFITNRYDDLEF